MLTLLHESLIDGREHVKLHGKILVPALRLLLAGCCLGACSHSQEPHPTAPAPAPSTSVVVSDAGASPAAASSSAQAEGPHEPVRTALGLRGSQLYIPTWFTAAGGRYDLIVHFHGEGRWQEENIEHAKLNVAVVSINLGLGTNPYSDTFKDPEVFQRLLADVESEIAKDGRGGATPKLHRLALSAWSAGFSSVSRVMTDSVAERVDAVLLADGFFTNFSDVKKRKVNKQGLERFVKYAALARKNEKLFSLTHTTIPTGPYPSVQECANVLLELTQMTKKQCSVDGPRPKMHQFYTVDEGSFHIHGFQGVKASDHVRQLHAMGETTYPYLKARWDKQDAEEATPR